MDRPLSVFVALVLVPFCDGLSKPEFCHGKQCPEYKIVKKTEFFEEREYEVTKWITTKVESKTETGVIAAYKKLKEFCPIDTYNAIKDNWPVLLTSKGDILEVSWFVHDKSPKTTEESISLEQRPAATIYVRVFGGYPSIKTGQENLEKLHDALKNANKTFDPNTFSGAVYDQYLSSSHHNEVWVPAA